MQYIHIFFCFLTCSSDQAPNPECKRSVNFEISFWYLQFFQKNGRKQFNLRYHSSLHQIFCSFFGSILDKKSPFEIN